MKFWYLICSKNCNFSMNERFFLNHFLICRTSLFIWLFICKLLSCLRTKHLETQIQSHSCFRTFSSLLPNKRRVKVAFQRGQMCCHYAKVPKQGQRQCSLSLSVTFNTHISKTEKGRLFGLTRIFLVLSGCFRGNFAKI